MVLLKAGLLPLVVDRGMRTNYIGALESADYGNLESLTNIFAALEKNAILQALSLDVEAEQRAEKSLTSAVIESLEVKFNKRRQVRRQELLGVNAVAERLRLIASESVERSLQDLTRKVFLRDERPEVRVTEGGPDRVNSHWYKFEVTRLNEALISKKWINFSEINASFSLVTSNLYQCELTRSGPPSVTRTSGRSSRKKTLRVRSCRLRSTDSDAIKRNRSATAFTPSSS